MNALKHIESGYLASGEGHVYISCHPPAAGSVGKRAVFVAPHAEERKSAYRLLYEMAGALSLAGWAAYRFDHRGAGESKGEHCELTLERWVEDCITVVNNANNNEDVWLVGARLGANVALKAAAECSSVKGVVLWEPLLSGETYVHDMVRRKQIKEMMGQGQAESGEDALEAIWRNGGNVDFDGFEMGPELRDELSKIRLKDDIMAAPGHRLLLCHTGGARNFSGAWEDIPSLIQSPSEAVCIRQKPFWGLLDYQENLELKDTTIRYMETHA